MQMFRSYPSITSFDKKASVNLLSQAVPNDEKWHVLEKIHGCNFMLQTDGTIVQAGSRNKFVSDFDLVHFHHCGEIVEKYKENMLDLFKMINREKECKELIVYGELFGGQYPGFPQTKPVQKEILYCPKVNFAGMDVRIDSKFTSKTECNKWLESSGILFIPSLFIGTKEEAFAYSEENYDKPSTIPSLLGLSEIANTANTREGHVIQPENVYYAGGKSDRVIFKHKNEKWCERSAKVKPISKSEMAETELFKTACEMITQNRMTNIISHYTEELHEGKLIGLFTQDILKELEDEPNPKQIQQFKKQLSAEIKANIENWKLQEE
jgi:Rnl2 family RNA ligase